MRPARTYAPAPVRSLAVHADAEGRRDEGEKESAYGLRGAHTFYFYFARCWITREEQDSEPGEVLVHAD